jgi:electron transfer flavoprotein alpha/beta subunit
MQKQYGDFMEILVRIKQVPALSHAKIDAVTDVLKQNGADSKMNLYNLCVDKGIYQPRLHSNLRKKATAARGTTTITFKTLMNVTKSTGYAALRHRFAEFSRPKQTKIVNSIIE